MSVTGRLIQSVMASLDAVRRARHISQDRLAESVGTRQGHISDLLAGRRDDVLLSTIVRVADALDHDVEIRVVPRQR